MKKRISIPILAAVVVVLIAVIVIVKPFPQKASAVFPEKQLELSCTVARESVDGAEKRDLTDAQKEALLKELETVQAVRLGTSDGKIGPYDQYVYRFSFENQQVAQIAHDMFFLLVLTVLLKVFSEVYRITGRTLETLKQFSHLTLPVLCLSLGPAAGSVTAAGYYELALGLIFLIERFKDPKQMQMHHAVKYIFFLLFHKITPFSPAPFSRHTPDDAFPGYRFWRDILPKSP